MKRRRSDEAIEGEQGPSSTDSTRGDVSAPFDFTVPEPQLPARTSDLNEVVLTEEEERALEDDIRKKHGGNDEATIQMILQYRKEAVLANKRADKAEKEMKNGYIKKGGPKLGRHVGTTTTAAGPYKNKVSDDLEVTTQDGTFGFLDSCALDKLRNTKSMLWQEADQNEMIWTNHGSICDYVIKFFNDVIPAADLSDKIKIVREPTVSSFLAGWVSPDITVIRSVEGAVLGMCEVKTPKFGNNHFKPLTPEQYKQQVGRYMLETRHKFGVRNAFCVLTDYNHWIIYWLDDVDEIARATTLEQVKAASEKNATKPANHQSITIFKSQTFECNSSNLTVAIASLLYKMCLSNVVPPDNLLGDSFAYPFFTPTSVAWNPIKPIPKILSVEMPTKGDVEAGIYLIQTYHGGADGRVWLTMDKKGNLAVLKILKNPLQDRVNLELNSWQELWCASVDRVKIDNAAEGLMLPFAFHIRPDFDESNRISHMRFSAPATWTSTSKRFNVLDSMKFMNLDEKLFDMDNLMSHLKHPDRVAETALETMHNAGIWHLDVEWRHVALLPVRKDAGSKFTFQPIMIDLSRVTRDPNEILDGEGQRRTNADGWVRQMMDRLLGQLVPGLLEKILEDPLGGTPDPSPTEETFNRN